MPVIKTGGIPDVVVATPIDPLTADKKKTGAPAIGGSPMPMPPKK
jgi:hypothetical protein